MRFNRLALALAVTASCEAAPVFAQSLPLLPRTTSTTGLNDSALTLIADSAHRTRAASVAVLRGVLGTGMIADSATGAARAQILTTARTIGGTSFNGSANITPGLADSSTGSTRAQKLTTARTVWGQSFDGTANVTAAPTFGAGATISNGQTLTLGTSTISGTPTWSSRQTFAAGQVADTAIKVRGLLVDTATLAKNLTGSPAITVSSCTGCGGGATVTDTVRAVTFDSVKATRTWNALGSAVLPPYSFTQARGAGMFAVGNATADTVRFATDSALSLSLSGGATAKLIGGAGSMTITAGTGVSRNLSLVATDASSNPGATLVLTASTFLQGGAGNMTIQSGTGNSRSLTINTTDGSGSTRPALTLGADSTVTALGTLVVPDSIRFSDAASAIRGGTGSMTIQAGTGNSRRLVLQTTTSGGTATTALRFNEAQQSLFADGSASRPSAAFGADTTTGFYRNGSGNPQIAISGSDVIEFSGGGGAGNIISGAAGNMTINAGTGNSRTMTLTTRTSVGTVKNNLVLGADSSATFLGKVKLADSLNLSASGAVIRNNATGDMTIRSGNGGNSSLTIKTTNSGGSESSNFNISTSSAGPQLKVFSLGSASLPIYSSIDGDDGLYFAGNSGDTTGIANAGTSQIRFIGNKWIGGDASTTIQAGVGNSRRFTAQTTTSGGTATTFLRANELQQSLFADGAAATPGIGWASDTLLGFSRVGTAGASDSIRVSANGIAQVKIAPAGVLLLPLLPAESLTKNAMCWDGATFNVTQNAAPTCTVSSARFKKNILPLSAAAAWAIVNRPQLHTSTYEEKEGGRKAIGIVAEQADSADTRLASRDAKGLITSTNYEEVTSLLLTVVKDLQPQVDSIKALLLEVRTMQAQMRAQQKTIDSLVTVGKRNSTRKP